MTCLKNPSCYAPVVLRLGLAFVYIWFGVSQIINAPAWTGLVPVWATDIFEMNATKIVHLNGYLELLLGSLLAVGIYVRWVAAFLFLHLAIITSHLGFTAIGVRDFGLSFATLALSLFGDDMHCLTRATKKEPMMSPPKHIA